MKRSPCHGVALVALAAGVGGLGGVAPAEGGEAPTQSTFVTPVPPGTGGWTGVEGAGDASGAATGVLPSPRDGRTTHDQLLELTGKARATPGRIAAMPNSVVAVEEDPQVDRAGALRSVIQSTASAVPWLHLTAPPATGPHSRRGDAEIAGLAEHARRFDEAQTSRTASSRGTEQGGAEAGPGDSPPQLTRELAQFARELLVNPLAWMLGFLAVLVAVTVSVIRRRGH